jgi:curved DNA-binding protein CbpA
VTDPFSALGLAADQPVTDDDVRAAWRRIAAATHPDRADGGDPAAFAAAAASYAILRTRSGRGEAVADREQARVPGGTGSVSFVSRIKGQRIVASLAWRLRRGRPGRLALRLAAAVVIGAVAVLAVGWQPATAGLITGACTWLILTGRHDLAGPPPG